MLSDSNLKKSSIFPSKIHILKYGWVSNESSWKCECETDDNRTIQSWLFTNNSRIRKNIYAFQKCYLALLTLRWYNKLWTELWCLEVGRRCEKKIVWRAEMSSQPAASQLTSLSQHFIGLKSAASRPIKNCLSQSTSFSQPIAVCSWLVNTVY